MSAGRRRRRRQAGWAAGHEDVHGDADVDVAAAGSDGGGRQGRGGVVVVGVPMWESWVAHVGAGWGGLLCHPVLALNVFLRIQIIGSDFFKSI